LRVEGKVVRFDDVRGYGFITPDMGGDDIFLHVNDLEIEKQLARTGTRVSFEIEEGERGKFATGVRLSSGAVPAHSPGKDSHDPGPDDDYYDVLSVDEFRHVITEMLLRVSPPITGQQILEVRSSFEQLARKQRWIEP
jgi:CspA family cold shock protein